jgi:pilus assembly protein CpaB
MDVRKLVLLVGALVIAAITAVIAKNMFTGASAPAADAKPIEMGPEVLVSTRAMPVGTIITAEALKFQPWPKELVDKAYFLKGTPGVNAADLIGTVVRNEISAGQPISQGSLIKPGDRGFLAAALGPGMRAVTVAVGTISGVAGFVFPGDRVDLILTQEVAGADGALPLKVAETILRNVRVLACRSAHLFAGRRRQADRQEGGQRDPGGHAQDRREDPGRLDGRRHYAGAALDRRHHGRPRARRCQRPGRRA